MGKARCLGEEEFKEWMGAALAGMHGLAISIAIVGETARLRHSNRTIQRLIGASARDAVSIIASLHSDQYRHGGIEGVSKRTLGQIKCRSGCWLDRTFGPVKDDLIHARRQKPSAVLSKIDVMRNEWTAHLPKTQTEAFAKPLTTEDMWQAYGWFKEMLLVWRRHLDPPYEWFDEPALIATIRSDLTCPILPADNIARSG